MTSAKLTLVLTLMPLTGRATIFGGGRRLLT
jgi:hypothetical protein